MRVSEPSDRRNCRRWVKVGGRLVMPVGPAYTTQQLTVVEKIAPGKTTTRAVALVRFVPFTRSQN
jgi:protein-L-isoaspartate(D-aspartate) O-methyltransferase